MTFLPRPRRFASLLRRRSTPYVPESYWEGRAAELIDTYDHPETWDAKGWARAGAEEELVPRLLAEHGARSVLVVGAGSGRQYDYLLGAGLAPRGFDIAPSLVAACRERYPQVDTRTDSVVGAHERHEPADAVLASAVLQHVPPAEIGAAMTAVAALARRIVVLREISRLDAPSTYIFAHDYDRLLPGWSVVHREVTDAGETYEVTLTAWVPA